MKLSEVKIWDEVSDTEYKVWGKGSVIEIEKTAIKVKFNYGVVVYDANHLQFLKSISENERMDT